MKYYKIIKDDTIIEMIGQDCGGEEITKQEYYLLLDLICNKPEAEEGYDYRLLTNLNWEKYKIE